MREQKASFSKAKARKILGFSAQNTLFLEAALSHPSYRHENRCAELESFDRMEFFGDAILNYIICKRIYALFPNAKEGELSRLRSTLVSRKILARVAKELRLSRHIRLGKSLKKQAGISKDKIFADTLEAVLAAIYFDAGPKQTEQFILKHFEPYLNAKRLHRLNPNPKSALQELCQKHWQKLPDYFRKTSAEGTTTEIVINSRLKASATAASKRVADEKCARILIRKIRQELG